MASPVVVSQAVDKQADSFGTTFNCDLPASVESGDLLLWLVSINDGKHGSFPAGFTELYDIENSESFVTGLCAYKFSSGSESATEAFTLDTEDSVVAIIYRISGAINPSTQVPEYAAVSAAGNTVTHDPPSLTPTGGSKDYLWFAISAIDTRNITVDTFPTSYTNTGDDESQTSGSGAIIAYCNRARTALSEDPAAFTISATRRSVTATIVIHPVGVGGGEEFLGRQYPQGVNRGVMRGVA